VEQPELSALARAGKKRPLWTPSATTHEVDFGRAAVEKLLPHRPPFLFVDRITSLDLTVPGIAGTRRIDPKDPIFVGHFPTHPIYPGVLLLETMGQLGICLAHFTARKTHELAPDTKPVDVRALKIHTALFLAEVSPGDEVQILATELDANDQTAICAGQILKGDVIAAFAVMEVYLVAT
jgi:3-hydroxymyristoyl/3-hydroxydecanoyl-(acyl carrier protein) dehydratase